jgi:outer membrane protein insertion porin family
MTLNTIPNREGSSQIELQGGYGGGGFIGTLGLSFNNFQPETYSTRMLTNRYQWEMAKRYRYVCRQSTFFSSETYSVSLSLGLEVKSQYLLAPHCHIVNNF